MLERTLRDEDTAGVVMDVSSPAPPRVYIASEVRLFREGLTITLTQHGGLVVVGAGSRSDALSQLGGLVPDVLLLDVAGRDSLALPREALMAVPHLRVIAFAVADVGAEVLACAEAGFSAYVARDGSIEDLVEAVHRAFRGELVCSPRIASMLFSRLGSISASRCIPSADLLLTRREREIATLVARGLQNKEVARRLGISDATIKNHVHNILQKLNIRGRGEIAMLRMSLALNYLVLSTYWCSSALSNAFESTI